ncbi:MAG: hypothetical protein LN560_03410, partial [Rickettsia endosymbiont of Sceptobius lativentris]|nr:hypothetical protein [Rickettsia endosymbiont of Sceptobius lativentris]
MDRNTEESFRANAIKVQDEALKRQRISSEDAKLLTKKVKIDNNQILDKCFSYVFKILNIDVKIIKQGDDFHISEVLFNRIGTGNDGNHIIPISFFRSLITHFFTAGNKTNDCISKAQHLLTFFHKILNSTEEYDVMLTKLCEITNEDSNICCTYKLEIFFCKTFIPYIIYIWDTRVSAKHFDSVDTKIVSSAGNKVRTFNQKVQNLLNALDNIDSKKFYDKLVQIRETLFQVIDIPIFIQKNTDITQFIDNSHIVNQYFKEVLLFFVYRIIKIEKPAIMKEKEKLINNIQCLQNKASTVRTKEIIKLVGILSQLKQEISPQYSKIVDKLSSMKTIKDFCSNNTESLSCLIKEYLDSILYDVRKHLQLYLSIIEQEASRYDNMNYLYKGEYKDFLKGFFNKKNFLEVFFDKFKPISNKEKLMEMFDSDNESELSFQYSENQSLSIENELQVNSTQKDQKALYKKIGRIATLNPFQQKELIHDVLNQYFESEFLILQLARTSIGRISTIKWYCAQIEQKDDTISQTVKNILTKCTTHVLKDNIRIQGKKPYEWYLDNENDTNNRIAVTQSILSQDDNTYVTEFCQYILTKDESVIACKGGKKRDNYPFIVWYIDNISNDIAKCKYRDTISNILIKCDKNIIQKLLSIQIDQKNFLEWYIGHTKITYDFKLQATKSVISKCEDDTIIDLIFSILHYSNDYINFISELMLIKVSGNDTAIKWYLNSTSVSHNDKVEAIDTIIDVLGNDHSNIVQVVKYILDTNNEKLITKLMSINIHNDNTALQWYLSRDSTSVSHDDKVTAINTVI